MCTNPFKNRILAKTQALLTQAFKMEAKDKLNQKQAMAEINKYIWTILPLIMICKLVFFLNFKLLSSKFLLENVTNRFLIIIIDYNVGT